MQSRVVPKRKSDGEWKHDRFEQESQSSRRNSHNRSNRGKSNSKTHQQNEKPISEEKCYLCQQLGHIARDCPNSDVGVVKSETVPEVKSEVKPKIKLPKSNKHEASPATIKKPLGYSQKPFKWTRKRREPEKNMESTVPEKLTPNPGPRTISGKPIEPTKPCLKPTKQNKKPREGPAEKESEVFCPQRRQPTMDLSESSGSARSSTLVMPSMSSQHQDLHRREIPVPKSNHHFTRDRRRGSKQMEIPNMRDQSRNTHREPTRHTPGSRERVSEPVKEDMKPKGSWGARQRQMELKPSTEGKSLHPLSTPSYHPTNVNTQFNPSDEKNISSSRITAEQYRVQGIPSQYQGVSDMQSAPSMQSAPNMQSTPNMQSGSDMRSAPNMQSAPQGMWPNPNAPELYEAGEDNRMMYMMPQQPIVFYPQPFFMMDQNMPEMMYPMMGYQGQWMPK